VGGPLYASEHQWVAAQRRALGAVGCIADARAALAADAPDLSLRPARRAGSGAGRARGSGARTRPPRAAGGGQVLRRPPRLSSIAVSAPR
jgi:hypothetical protein